MTITHDTDVDAKYICLRSGVSKRDAAVRTEQVADWLNVDYAKDGSILGVEVLDASRNEGTIFIVGDSVTYLQDQEERNLHDGGIQIDIKVPEYDARLIPAA